VGNVVVRSIGEAAVVNRSNYLLVNEHLKYLEEVQQLSVSSVTRYRAYLRHLLRWADETPLAEVDRLRPVFPAYISSLKGRSGDVPMAAATQKKIIDTTKRFFLWAKMVHADQFKVLPRHWIDMLRPPRIGHSSDEHVYVTVSEAIHLTTLSVEETDIALWRDQAAAAMLFLSGMRASAFTTMPISAVDLSKRTVHQWPELGVLTKNSKRATTYLLPIRELIEVVNRWDKFVRARLPETAPWYAPVESQWGLQSLSDQPPGKNRHIALNQRLRVLYQAAGLEYKSAHKFRHGNAVYGLQHAKDMADYKAVSMNLMHEDIKITDQIYAPLLSDEIQQRINRLSVQPEKHNDDEVSDFMKNLTDEDLSRLMMMVAKRLAS
jgi:site-specific recombinase XerD